MVKIYYLDFWCELYGNPLILEDINDLQKWLEADKYMSRNLLTLPNGVGLIHFDELCKYINLEKANNPDEADILVVSCFGNQKVKYKDSDKKIILLGYEKYVVDMDYHKYKNALYITTFNLPESLCKYYYLPLFYIYRGFSLTDILFQKREKPDKHKFCLSIISNVNASDRKNIIQKIMLEIKSIDNYGKLFKNANDSLIERTCWYDARLKDKIKPYKFMIAFENESVDNYNTEKLLNAWLGGAIPIYWGDNNITKYYNSKAFININELGIEQAIEKIKQLDNDEYEYDKMFSEPLLTEQCVNIKFLNEDNFRNTIKDFIFSD